jgi:hypothetical protein
MPGGLLSHPTQPCRFLYNTSRQGTSRKRGVYRTFAPKGQTQFPCRQATNEATTIFRRPQFRFAAFGPVSCLNQNPCAAIY